MSLKRFAYVKNGDVVEQLRQYEEAGRRVVTSGPNAFISEFLGSLVGDGPALLISKCSNSDQHRVGRLEARVFGDGRGVLGKAYARTSAMLKTFYHVWRFHPENILCGRSGYTLLVCWLAARVLRVPIVHARHNRLDKEGESAKWYRSLEALVDRWVIRRCDGVICHGPYLREQLLDLGVPGRKVIEFDVDLKELETRFETSGRTRDTGKLDAHRTILFAGRIEERKGVTDLLEAARDYLSADDRLTLIFAGSGSDLDRLRRLAGEYGVAGQVELPGRVDHDRLVELLVEATMLIAPTREGFPEGRCMSVMEALVGGIPVIAPDFGPFPYLVKNGINGFLYEPDSVEDLNHKIGLVLNNDAGYQRLREGARESGHELTCSVRTFAQAVKEAFMRCDRNASATLVSDAG